MEQRNKIISHLATGFTVEGHPKVHLLKRPVFHKMGVYINMHEDGPTLRDLKIAIGRAIVELEAAAIDWGENARYNAFGSCLRCV